MHGYFVNNNVNEYVNNKTTKMGLELFDQILEQWILAFLPLLSADKFNKDSPLLNNVQLLDFSTNLV